MQWTFQGLLPAQPRFTMEDSDLRKKSHELLRLSTNWTCAVCFADMPQ